MRPPGIGRRPDANTVFARENKLNRTRVIQLGGHAVLERLKRYHPEVFEEAIKNSRNQWYSRSRC